MIRYEITEPAGRSPMQHMDDIGVAKLMERCGKGEPIFKFETGAAVGQLVLINLTALHVKKDGLVVDDLALVQPAEVDAMLHLGFGGAGGGRLRPGKRREGREKDDAAGEEACLGNSFHGQSRSVDMSSPQA